MQQSARAASREVPRRPLLVLLDGCKAFLHNNVLSELVTYPTTLTDTPRIRISNEDVLCFILTAQSVQ